MSRCYNPGDFRKYFKQNMEALGLPVPSTLIDRYQTAIGTASSLVGTLVQLDKGATMAELAGATVGLEKRMVAASLGAAAYAGAVIGGIAIASGRAPGCGSRLSDMFVFVRQNRLQFPGWQSFYARNPVVLDDSRPFRSSFGMRAESKPAAFEYA